MDCIDFSLIPTFNHPYLNSIIVSLLFNENLRKIIDEQLSKWTVSSSNKLKSFFKLFIENLKTNKIDIKKLYSYLNPIDILRNLPPVNNKRDKWYPDYITKVLRDLDINFIIIIYDSNKNLYLIDTSSFSSSTTLSPDVIVFYHSRLNDNFSFFTNVYFQLSKTNPTNAEKQNLNSYGISFTGLDNYSDNIRFNNNNYDLEGCIVSNNLATTGFMCNKQKFVYNHLEPVSLCSVDTYEWSLKSQLETAKCLSTSECKLREKSCYSFKDRNRLLIYVRNTENKSLEKKLKERETLKAELKQELKDELKDEFKSEVKGENIEAGEITEELPQISEMKSREKQRENKDYLIQLLVEKNKELELKRK